jgi:hypothetical protein
VGTFRSISDRIIHTKRLITRTREANTFVPKPISCREAPRERPPAIAYDIAMAR